MSTKFLGRMAAGVALGTAALVFSAPGIAFADEAAPVDAAKQDVKHEKAKHLDGDSGIDQSDKSAFNTAQNNESENKVIAKAKDTAVAVNIPVQINLGGLGLVWPLSNGSMTCTNGVSDEVLESATEIQSLSQAAEFLQRLDTECSWKGKGKGKYQYSYGKGLVPVGDVAGGDGGATTETGAIAAAGAGMLGVATLGGLVLLRRRAADEPVA